MTDTLPAWAKPERLAGVKAALEREKFTDVEFQSSPLQRDDELIVRALNKGKDWNVSIRSPRALDRVVMRFKMWRGDLD